MLSMEQTYWARRSTLTGALSEDHAKTEAIEIPGDGDNWKNIGESVLIVTISKV